VRTCDSRTPRIEPEPDTADISVLTRDDILFTEVSPCAQKREPGARPVRGALIVLAVDLRSSDLCYIHQKTLDLFLCRYMCID
jgi:hypothetical protein